MYEHILVELLDYLIINLLHQINEYEFINNPVIRLPIYFKTMKSRWPNNLQTNTLNATSKHFSFRAIVDNFHPQAFKDHLSYSQQNSNNLRNQCLCKLN